MDLFVAYGLRSEAQPSSAPPQCRVSTLFPGPGSHQSHVRVRADLQGRLLQRLRDGVEVHPAVACAGRDPVAVLRLGPGEGSREDLRALHLLRYRRPVGTSNAGLSCAPAWEVGCSRATPCTASVLADSAVLHFSTEDADSVPIAEP